MQLFLHNMQAYDAMKTMLGKMSKAAGALLSVTGKSLIGFRCAEENLGMCFLCLSTSDYIYQTQGEDVLQVVPDFSLGNICAYSYAPLVMIAADEIAPLIPDGIALDESRRCNAKYWDDSVKQLLCLYLYTKQLELLAITIRYLYDQCDMADEIFERCAPSEVRLGKILVQVILLTPTYLDVLYQTEGNFGELLKRVAVTKLVMCHQESQRRIDDLYCMMEKVNVLRTIFEKPLTQKSGKHLVPCVYMCSMRSRACKWFGRSIPGSHCCCAYQSFVKDENEYFELLFFINMLNECMHVRKVSSLTILFSMIFPMAYKQQIGLAFISVAQGTSIWNIANGFAEFSRWDSLYANIDEVSVRLRRGHCDNEVLERKFIMKHEMNDAMMQLEARSIYGTRWQCIYNEAKRFPRPMIVWICWETTSSRKNFCWKNESASSSRRKAGPRGARYSQRSKNVVLDALGMLWKTCKEHQRQVFFETANMDYRLNGNLRVSQRYDTMENLSCAAGYTTSIAHGSRASARHGIYIGSYRDIWGLKASYRRKGDSLIGLYDKIDALSS